MVVLPPRSLISGGHDIAEGAAEHI